MNRKRRLLACRVACFAVALIATASAGHAQIHFAAQMTTEQYRTLDRSKTVVILTDGILEEHGPYLPAFTDGYISERLVQDVAAAIVERGWNVLVFPTIPLGSGGANELAAKYPFPGTFVVRVKTLRAVYMDLADELAEAGFRFIFVANNHGAPNHNRALDEVCDYFNETYAGHMIVLRGVPTPSSAAAGDELQKMMSEEAKREDAGSGHAGVGETSLMLFLKPGLVDPTFKASPPQTAPNFTDMLAVAKGANWPGYFGAPRFSTARYGARLYRSWSDEAVAQALKTLDGNAPKIPSFGGMQSPHNDAALKRDDDIANRQQEWLKRKGLE